jgi:DNA-binding LacI/PurR family transcriptional regulator
VGARLKDVADRAGVSFKTVSNVINNHPNVTPQTREKVMAAIAELRYRPNMTARSLRHGRSGFLAFALPELTSPYFAALASEVGSAAKREGLVVLIEETRGEREGERIVLEGLASHLIDGIIFSPMATPASEVAARSDSTPMVLLGERGYPAGYDHIAVDNIRAAREVTEHLLACGRTRIAAIGAEHLDRNLRGDRADRDGLLGAFHISMPLHATRRKRVMDATITRNNHVILPVDAARSRRVEP